MMRSNGLVTMARWAVAGLGLCGATACEWFGEEEPLYINSTMHKIVEEDEAEAAPAGRSCTNISSGSSGTGAALGGANGEPSDFWMQESSDSSGLLVVIGSLDQVLVRRRYDRNFVAGYEFDRFIVTTRGGDRYAFNYWGSDTCNDCPPTEYDPLPGDSSGCGTPGSEHSPVVEAGPDAPLIDPEG